MKSSVRDLLSWVWQVLLSWLTAIGTGIDPPSLCLERSTKMVVKANDPEMAVCHDAQRKEEEAMVKKEPPGVVLTEEEEVSEPFLKRDVYEVRQLGQTMIDEDEGTRMGELNGGVVDRGIDVTSEDTSSDSSTLNNSNDDIAEANAASADVAEEDSLPFANNEIDLGNPFGEEENADSSAPEDRREDGANLDETHNADENWDSNNRDQRNYVNENDDENDNENDDEEEEESEVSTSVDTSVTWLQEIGSRETYQKVLYPQYYCLNFRTVAPIQSESVNTALKQLRCLLPWLGFGLKQQKKKMWLCLFPEDNINLQTADNDDSLWDVVTNSRNQFDYLEDKCLCSFVFMKAYPCTQCQALSTQTRTSLCVAAKDSACSSTEITSNTSNAHCATAHMTGATPTVSTNMEKNVCGDTSASQVENSDAALGTVSNTGDIIDSSIVPSKIPSTASPIESVINADSVTKQEIHNSSSVPYTLGMNPADNAPYEPASVAYVVNEKTFSNNYRLVFGVPHPLADEKSVDEICDAFLKELDAVIKKTTTCSLTDTEKNDSIDSSEIASENEAKKNDSIDTSENEVEKKDSVDTGKIAGENEESNGTLETDSSSKVDRGDHPQCEDANEAVFQNATSEQVGKEVAQQEGATTDSDITQETSEQVDKEVAQQEGATTDNDITQESIIAKNKASVQQQFTVLADIFANTENVDADKQTENITNNNNNNENVVKIDRNSPHVDRTIEFCDTRNFINKCKSERVSFVSGFALCVNAAVVNTLVKLGVQEENDDLKIGLRFSQYYNSLEDLTDHEWHDHDPAEEEDDDDDKSQDGMNAVCCRKPTTSFNGRPKDWNNQLWERVQDVEQKRRDVLSEGTRSPSQVIPLNTNHESNNEKFPSICLPNADLSVSNIGDVIPRFSRQLENIESMTLQKLSPHVMFFMTNCISLCYQNGNLRFSFYHEGRFVPHDTAHQYADEIVSVLNRSLIS